MIITLSELTQKFNMNPVQLYKNKFKDGLENFLINSKIEYKKKCQRRILIELTEDTINKLIENIVEPKKLSKFDQNRTRYIDYLKNFHKTKKEMVTEELVTESESKFTNVVTEIERLYQLDKKIKSLGLTDDELIELEILRQVIKKNKIEIFEGHMIIKTKPSKLTLEGEEVIIVYGK